jgi:hypothetical protein
MFIKTFNIIEFNSLQITLKLTVHCTVRVNIARPRNPGHCSHFHFRHPKN